MAHPEHTITVGVLALQGAFSEHLQLLRRAFAIVEEAKKEKVTWSCAEVRTPEQLSKCDALIMPGGESTTMTLVATRSGLLEPLREFVKVKRKATWGTCAGLILLAEAANRTKQGGQDLIGGIDVRVNRNHFGRQVESFETELYLQFLEDTHDNTRNAAAPFRGVFIRAPIVEKILPHREGKQEEEEGKLDSIVAPSRTPDKNAASWTTESPVVVLATLPSRSTLQNTLANDTSSGDIIAVKQGNIFGTSFHPELTNDARIHVWWLENVRTAVLEEDR